MKPLFCSVLLLFLSLTSFSQKSSILFKRLDEPIEKAFSLLVPHGWLIEEVPLD